MLKIFWVGAGAPENWLSKQTHVGRKIELEFERKGQAETGEILDKAALDLNAGGSYLESVIRWRIFPRNRF